MKNECRSHLRHQAVVYFSLYFEKKGQLGVFETSKMVHRKSMKYSRNVSEVYSPIADFELAQTGLKGSTWAAALKLNK